MVTRIALIVVAVMAALLGCGGEDPRPDSGAFCSGTAELLARCDMDGECATCLCRGQSQERFCTRFCSESSECPSPSSGCAQGICMP